MEDKGRWGFRAVSGGKKGYVGLRYVMLGLRVGRFGVETEKRGGGGGGKWVGMGRVWLGLVMEVRGCGCWGGGGVGSV